MKTYSLFLRICVCAVSSLTLASCEIWDDEHRVDNNRIEFSVATATGADGEPLTRATKYGDSPVVMLGKGGRDTLYLHASIDVNMATVDEESMAETRGVPVKTDNFAAVCENFSVTAYTADEGKLFMSNELVKQSGNVWSPANGTRYWPEDALNFFAYAPYSVNDKQVFPDGISINNQPKTIDFSYTVPTTTDKRDAEAQPDVMFATTTCGRAETTGENGTVPLTFSHALAAVKFVANDIAGSTINSITLKGLHGSGTCIYSADAEDSKYKWRCTDDKNNTYTQTFDVKVEDQQQGEQPITDKNPSTTFMMLPQQLEGATVEINLTTNDNKQHTLTGKLNTGNLTEWKAGYVYTYKISSESINWTYVFDVTDNISLPLGGTSGTYNVISYRYRTQNPSVKEPVAWSVTDKSGTETQYQAQGEPENPIEGDALDEVITTFTEEGKGGGDDYEKGINYPIVVARTKLITDWGGDSVLRAKTPKGSSADPYDLSTEGGTINETTANCYVVHAAGTYKLPLVYGNARKNGVDNPEAYNKDEKFVDYNGNHIKSPYISNSGTPDNATLVWSDGFYMFKDVKLSADKKYLIFTIDQDYIQQANAVVAVRDAGGNIMWSWHIWVTEHPVLTETAEISEWQYIRNKFYLMEWNLGWVDGKMVFYNPRKLDFVFTQDMTGTQQNMTLTQDGAKLDYKDIGSTYYQWGRKDPIVALKNRNQLGVDDYRPMETPREDYQYKVKKGLTYMKDAIRNPNIYYVEQDKDNEHKWLYSTSFTYRLWDGNSNHYAEIDERSSTKTVYDPSPRGFKVPFPKVFAGFVHGSTGDGSKPNDPASVGYLNGYIDETGYRYHVFLAPYGKKGDPEITFTATGQRASRDNLAGADAGGLWAMDGVYFWTCNAIRTGQSYTFVLRKDLPGHGTDLVYSYGFSGTQAMARPVRCMKE